MSGPNTWAKATVVNNTGTEIKNVELRHRYDTDHYDNKSWEKLSAGEEGEPFAVGYWTGAFRTGKDYWWVRFEEAGNVRICKENFYCFLKSEDANQIVKCEVTLDKMIVHCPKSSSCQVSLQQV